MSRLRIKRVCLVGSARASEDSRQSLLYVGRLHALGSILLFLDAELFLVTIQSGIELPCLAHQIAEMIIDGAEVIGVGIRQALDRLKRLL